jgi:hypothetical protein
VTYCEFVVFVKVQVKIIPSVCSAYEIPRFCEEFSMEEEHVLYLTKKEHGVVQRKLVWGLFHAEKCRPL